MKFTYNGDTRVWDGECTVLRARRLLAGAKQEGFYFLTANLDRASAKLHSLFGERLHEVFEEEADDQWPSYDHSCDHVLSCDDDPAAANAIAGGDSDNWTSRYKRVYFVPIVRSKMATDVAGRRSKKTYVSLEAIGPGTFKVKDGLKACKFRWDEEAWHYDRDTDDRARKSFSQTARDLRAQFEIHRDGIPVRLKPASDEADEMHERMRGTPVEEVAVNQVQFLVPVEEAEVEEESVQEVEVEEEVTELGVEEEEVEDMAPPPNRNMAPPPNRNVGPPTPNRKRAAPAASHAGTMMSEVRSRPRVRSEPDAEATSVKREQSPEPSEATAQFAAGAPITPGQDTRVRRSPSA